MTEKAPERICLGGFRPNLNEYPAICARSNECDVAPEPYVRESIYLSAVAQRRELRKALKQARAERDEWKEKASQTAKALQARGYVIRRWEDGKPVVKESMGR